MNSFQKRFSQPLHSTRQFFLPVCNTFNYVLPHNYVLDTSIGEFRLPKERIILVFYIFRKILSYADVFCFSVRVSSSRGFPYTITGNSNFQTLKKVQNVSKTPPPPIISRLATGLSWAPAGRGKGWREHLPPTMLERDLAIGSVSICLSVHLSVCLSVTRWHRLKTNDRRITQFSPPGSENFAVTQSHPRSFEFTAMSRTCVVSY